MDYSGVMDAGRNLSVMGLFEHADPVVQAVIVVLILCSFVCWTIIFEKMLRISSLRADTERLDRLALSTSTLYGGQSDLIIAITGAAQAEQRESASDEPRQDLRDRMERAMRVAARLQLKRAEIGLPLLATIGSTAPFVGLFGTVWGVMHSFVSIAHAKEASLAVVAPGIAEALFATAVGLAAAIPAVVAYNQIAAALGRTADQMAAAAGRAVRRWTQPHASGH